MPRPFAAFFLPDGRMNRPQRLVLGVAIAYAAALLLTLVLLRLVGERWWATAVVLYLPRIGFLLPLPFLVAGLLGVRLRWAAWALLAASLPLGLLLMGFVFPWPTPAEAGAPSIRVFSYNVNSFYGGADHVVEIIDRYSPDVVFLEEVGPAEPISTLLRARYATVKVDTQFLVATRFPVRSSLDPGKVQYYGRQRSPRWIQEVMDTPLGPIAFYNVHPISPREGFYALRGHGLKHEILSGRIFTGDNKQTLMTNVGLRAAQVADFASAAREEKDPVIIVGDTNLPGMSHTLRQNLSEYQDGFAKAGWGFGYTFPTTHHPWMRIDRMFASAQLRFTHFEVGHSDVSDHDCIVADVQRAP